MLSTLFALAALMAAQSSSPTLPAPRSTNTSVASPAKVDRFAGRPQARIAFARDVRNFQVKRDGYDDILYLETGRDRWFRAEIICFGIDDPRDAQGLIPLDSTFGIQSASRVSLVGFGHRSNECTIDSLVELTPDEAAEFRLVRRRSAPAPRIQPAS